MHGTHSCSSHLEGMQQGAGLLTVQVDVPGTGHLLDGDAGGRAHEAGQGGSLDQQLHMRMRLPVHLRHLRMRPARQPLVLLEGGGGLEGRRRRLRGQQRPQEPAHDHRMAQVMIPPDEHSGAGIMDIKVVCSSTHTPSNPAGRSTSCIRDAQSYRSRVLSTPFSAEVSAGGVPQHHVCWRAAACSCAPSRERGPRSVMHAAGKARHVIKQRMSSYTHMAMLSSVCPALKTPESDGKGITHV